MDEEAWWRVGAFVATVTLAVVSFGFSKTTEEVDDRYRWIHEFNVGSTPNDTLDVTFRFPKGESGLNAPAAVGAGRSVDHLQISNGGTLLSEWVIYSRTIPAGADTIRLTANVRTFIFSGAPVDSCRYLTGTTGNRMSVYAAGGYN